MTERVFLIVLDSLGIGEMPDAALYGDKGSNTLRACSEQEGFYVPNLRRLGLFNIDGIDYGEKAEQPLAAYGRLSEKSSGKDTTTGHWEMCGIVSEKPFPTYPEGFPEEIIREFSRRTGRQILCNKPYSGTRVIEDYGPQQLESGALIVYTSADSVFQIAAHEDVIPLEQLYEYCRIARELLQGEHSVARVIARPFEGEYPHFRRAAGRHDFSLAPPEYTLPELLRDRGLEVIPIGKIYDIFAGKGLEKPIPTCSNRQGMELTKEYTKRDFHGLCFTNLVDFDMLYGHRNDAPGYSKALTDFDLMLGELLTLLKKEDVLIITADHGCDPLSESTDHSREYVPLLIYGEGIKNVNLGTVEGFDCIGKTVASLLKVKNKLSGKSLSELICKE